jgi:hypothetical protein
VVYLGGAAGGRPALTTGTTGTSGATANHRANKCPTTVHQRRAVAFGRHGQGMIVHKSAGMLSAT